MLPSASVPTQVIKDVLASRLMAQRSFLAFCRFTDPRYPWQAKHIQLMTQKLEQVERYIETGGKEGIGRLMIFMPPRYWKSQTVSRKFPAWVLGKLPETRTILTSYGADLATTHSKESRDLILSDRYQTIFGAMSAKDEPVILDPDSKSSAKWDIANHGGGMIAAGVGGAITGHGANLFIIDDPLKSREEADSAARRSMIHEWYQSTAYTRLEDGAAIVMVMTRWDVEDLAGVLLNAMVQDNDADQWEVVFLPAIALEEKQYPRTQEDYLENLLRGIYIPMGGDQLGRHPGEPLWPKKHDEHGFKVIRANSGDFEFTALYQQMPRLAAGEYFDDQDFNIIEKAPEGLSWYAYIDLALGESETSDYNVTGGVALDKEGNLYLRDRIKVQELEKFLPDVRAVMLAEDWRFTHWGVEDVAFQKLVFKEFAKDPGLVNVDIQPVKPNGDKVQRAQPWRRRAKNGKVFLVRGKWNLDFIRTVASFPKGRHDDDVDWVSGCVQMIAEEEGGERKTATSEAIVVEAEMFASVGV
jgi:predicted phage terminase large subunit-like protein